MASRSEILEEMEEAAEEFLAVKGRGDRKEAAGHVLRRIANKLYHVDKARRRAGAASR